MSRAGVAGRSCSTSFGGAALWKVGDSEQMKEEEDICTASGVMFMLLISDDDASSLSEFRMWDSGSGGAAAACMLPISVSGGRAAAVAIVY